VHVHTKRLTEDFSIKFNFESAYLELGGRIGLLRKTVSAILLFLLLVSMLTVASKIQPVKASGTIYIRADGSIDPPTAPIRRDGDIYKLTGNIATSAHGTIVERNNIVIDGAGYSIQKSGATGGPKGIALIGGINVTIKNVSIECFGQGIWLNYSSRCILFANNLTNTERGISLYNSSNNIICGNSICGIFTEDGITLSDSSNNSIYRNIIAGSKEGYGCGIMLSSSHDNSIYENCVKDNWRGVFYEWLKMVFTLLLSVGV
jgi:parallel beta-helix repeat protein